MSTTRALRILEESERILGGPGSGRYPKGGASETKKPWVMPARKTTEVAPAAKPVVSSEKPTAYESGLLGTIANTDAGEGVHPKDATQQVVAGRLAVKGYVKVDAAGRISLTDKGKAHLK